MKKNLVVALSLALIFGATAALASGGGLKTGASPQSSTSGVTVNIPGVVGIDVETDMVWNFGSYTPQAAGAAVGCPANTWPLQPNCSGSADYFPNASTTTAGVTNVSTNAGAVWISVFSNIATGVPTISISAPAFGTAPWTGYTAAGFYYEKDPGAAFNVPGAGPTTWTSVPVAPTSIGGTAMAAAFNWTRVDQDFKFTVPSAGTATFTPGTYSTTVTLTLSHS